MVFTWCALGYDAVLGNKADCHDKRRVSLWACCFCTLLVQKGLMLCVTLQNSWEGCFSGVLNWKRAPLMRRAGLTDRGEKPCVELCYFSGLLDSRDEQCVMSVASEVVQAGPQSDLFGHLSAPKSAHLPPFLAVSLLLCSCAGLRAGYLLEKWWAVSSGATNSQQLQSRPVLQIEGQCETDFLTQRNK